VILEQLKPCVTATMFKIAVFAMAVVACHAFAPGLDSFSHHEIQGPHTNERGSVAACSPGYSVCRMEAKWQGAQGPGDDTGMDGKIRIHNALSSLNSEQHPVIQLTLMTRWLVDSYKRPTPSAAADRAIFKW
jgi:hypothetical protein